MIGMIKAVQVVNAQMTSPNLHLQEITPKIAFEEFGVALPGACGGVEALGAEDKRERVITGQNSFGASGTNAHAAVEQTTPPRTRSEVQGSTCPVMYDRQTFAGGRKATNLRQALVRLIHPQLSQCVSLMSSIVQQGLKP